MCMFCRSLFVLLSFFFWPLSHCVVCSSIYGFWLPVLVSSNTFYSEQDNQRIVRKRDRFTSVLRKTKHNMLQISFMVEEKKWHGQNPLIQGEWILTVSFFLRTMKERKLIAETQDTIWIWIIHGMVTKWLNYTSKFNFTSGYFVQPRYRPRKNEKLFFWRVLAEN
jgi:hypothetical protein